MANNRNGVSQQRRIRSIMNALPPEHLAIIMDGNGRWALAKKRPRSYGHLKGTRVAKRIITACSRRGIKYLTLYAFSTENWFRPEREVNLLMTILQRYLKKETNNLIKENIRLRVIGDLNRLPVATQEIVNDSLLKTSHCTGLELIFAISYGSRQEILSAVQRIAQKVKENKITVDSLNEDLFEEHLFTVNIPDPDLIIRTSGEMRLSNFLLWQAAYSEFYFSDTLWPNFTELELDRALSEFACRNRRFGKVNLGSVDLSKVTL